MRFPPARPAARLVRGRKRPRLARAGASTATSRAAWRRSARSPPRPRSSSWMVRNPSTASRRCWPARARAPAPARHGRADAGAARGRRGGARGVPRAREHGRDTSQKRLARGLRPAGGEDAGGLLHGRVLQPRARRAARRRPRRASSCRSSRRTRSYLGGMDEAIAILKLCSPTGRSSTSTRCTTASGSSRGNGAHDRGRLHVVRASRDALPRRARAPHADHDERRAGAGGGQRQADHLHARAPRPPPHPDRRRLRGVRGRARSSALRSA